jgi:hypothetical protein
MYSETKPLFFIYIRDEFEKEHEDRKLVFYLKM